MPAFFPRLEALRRTRIHTATGLLLLGALAACGGDATSPGTPAVVTTPAALRAVSGGDQTGTVGSTLSLPLVVQVTTSAGAPVAGATVTFQVSTGDASLSSASAVTDASGQASTQVTLGAATGSVVVSAVVRGTSLAATFSLSAVKSAVVSASCDAGAPTSLAVGQTVTVGGNSLCLSGGVAGGEYALVAFNGASDAATRATVVVQPSGVDAPSGALTSVAAAGTLGTLDVASAPGASPMSASLSVSPREAFERRLRSTARAELAPKVGAARQWYASRGTGSGVRLNAIPGNVSVGTIVSLNANANDACTRPQMHAARVMAVGSKALVVADTLNPAGGYTQADYQSIAATFDTLVDAVDTKNFGQPTDIDKNGHVILFFTSAVNALTPKNADYYIGGFFYDRDLFPTTANSVADACATSNVAEMFYLMVPDPSGKINGNVFSKSFVTTVAIATTAHEYQHLINASRRLYVNDASDFEETWLDEGLAHAAEELVFYARAGLQPLADLDAAKIRSSTTYRSAFNDEGIDNFDRLSTFLEAPSSNSPYADNDSLETRGATWSFLRWAVDHQAPQASAQSAVFYQLVNSTTTGLANLRNVFGSDLTPLFRDWATSLVLDDIAGADLRTQFPSWNLRSIVGALSSSGSYPLSTQSLASGTPSTATVAGGGAAYLRFAVGAGKSASLAWTTSSANVAMTVVRLR